MIRRDLNSCFPLRVDYDPPQRKEAIEMITLNPSQTTTISNCLVTSSLLKNAFGTSNAQLQTISSYLTGNAATTAGNTTGASNTSSSATTSGVTSSSLLGSLIDTLA
jgi:hypothetical protein